MRGGVRWAKVTNAQGDGLEFKAVKDAFNFSVVPFSDKAIYSAKHNYELKKDDVYNYVKIDGFMRGVGSNSCGEDTRPECRNNNKEISYSFQLLPIKTIKE